MPTFDDASLNQDSDEDASLLAHNLNNCSSSEATAGNFSETAEEKAAYNNTIDEESHFEIIKRHSNDLSLKILKQAKEAEAKLNQFITPSLISTLVNGIRVTQAFDYLPAFANISPTLSALASIEPILPQASIASQIGAPFVDSLTGTVLQSVHSSVENLINTGALSIMKNVKALLLPEWSTITLFQQDLDFTLGSAFKNLELFNSSWLPSINLWDQFQPMDFLFSDLGKIANLAGTITASLLPSIDLWNRFQPVSFLFPIVSRIIDLTNSINTVISTLPDFLRRLKENLKQRVLAAFKRIVFCFASSMSEDLMYWVLEQVELGNSNIVVARLCNDYTRKGCAKLQQMVERWQDNPEFARRWRIIWQAFQHYMRKEYISAIRVLAPEVEGISKQVLMQNVPLKSPEGRQGRAQFSSPRFTITGALYEVVDKTQIDSPDIDIVSWVRFKSTVEFVENEFAKRIGFDTEYNDIRSGRYPRNRHGNLHGMQLDGFTAANSLRLFLCSMLYMIFSRAI